MNNRYYNTNLKIKSFYLIFTIFVLSTVIFTDLSFAQIKIMPLGNSITYDNNIGDTRPKTDPSRVAYRQKLFELLELEGYNFDFVGSENALSSGSTTVWVTMVPM